jgi:hypothetical protein
MGDWIEIYDGVFFITISTLLFGCFGLVIKYCLKSKGHSFFGLITVHRNVELEAQEEMKEMDIGVKEDRNLYLLF